MKKLLLTALLSCSLLCFSETYQVGTYPFFAPFEFLDENSAMTGFDIELMREIAKDQGFEVKFNSDHWKGIVEQLAEGKRDLVISALSDSEKRRQFADFSKPYLESDRFMLIYKKANLAVKSLEDLVNAGDLKIGAERDTASVDKLKQAGVKNIIEQASDFEGLKAVVRGDIDIYYGYVPSMSFILKRHENLAIYSSKLPEEPGNTIIAVRKGNPELLAKINRGIDNLRANGKLDELRKKWLN